MSVATHAIDNEEVIDASGVPPEDVTQNHEYNKEDADTEEDVEEEDVEDVKVEAEEEAVENGTFAKEPSAEVCSPTSDTESGDSRNDESSNGNNSDDDDDQESNEERERAAVMSTSTPTTPIASGTRAASSSSPSSSPRGPLVGECSPSGRPTNLPKKSSKLEKKHKKQHQKMLDSYRKKVEREKREKIDAEKRKLAREQRLQELSQAWEVALKTWHKSSKTKKVRQLWWSGVPPKLRQRAWPLGIGNDLHITPQLFDIFGKHAADAKVTKLRQNEEESSRSTMARKKFEQKKRTDASTAGGEEVADKDAQASNKAVSKSSSTTHASSTSTRSNADRQTPAGATLAGKEGTVYLIELDLPRTFPALSFFKEDGPMFGQLRDVLEAYVCYRPDIGYVQGMSYLAATLLLNMDTYDAFKCLANLLNVPCMLVFYKMDGTLVSRYMTLIMHCVKLYCPKVEAVMQQQGIMPETFAVDWLLTLYSKSLPLDVAARIWDVFMCEGEVFLFRVLVGILRLLTDTILASTFEENMHLLTHLPGDIDADELLRCVGAIGLSQKKYNALKLQIVGGTEELLAKMKE